MKKARMERALRRARGAVAGLAALVLLSAGLGASQARQAPPGRKDEGGGRGRQVLPRALLTLRAYAGLHTAAFSPDGRGTRGMADPGSPGGPGAQGPALPRPALSTGRAGREDA